MKNFLTIISIFFFIQARATHYYVATDGNDASSGLTGFPWKTLAKVNAVTFSAGDIISFNGGDIFYGGLNVRFSGSAGNPITFNSYGTGKATITGFTTVSIWTNLGSNIWESTSAISTLSQLNMVLIGGVNYAMGRFPNSGYLTYQTFSSFSSITSSSLNSGVTNWTGAEAVVRRVPWITDRNTITAHSGGTLTLTNISVPQYNGNNNYGFFIQNDTRTLDAQNEWYYSPTTKKIRIYSTSSPTSVQITTVDTLVKCSRNFITFDGVDFVGSNKMTFQITGASLTIKNCLIDYNGNGAVWGGQNSSASGSFIFQNNIINHTNGNAILLREFFTGALITGNTVKNTAVQPGMINRLINSNSNGTGIALKCPNTIAEYNIIDSSGYVGIGLWESGDIVRYNFINHSMLTIGDGGGIYSFIGYDGSGNPLASKTGQKVLNNIVLNSIGNNAGTANTGLPQAQGIYMDDVVGNVEIAYNTSSGHGNAGIYLHNTNNMNVHDNTCYDNPNGIVLDSDDPVSVRTTTLQNNIFFGKTATQNAANYRSALTQTDIRAFGTASSINNNYPTTPIDDNLTFLVKTDGQIFTDYNLASWRTFSLFDAASQKAPLTITNVNQLDFQYNATQSVVSKTLPPGSWKDVRGFNYSGTISLQPYASSVLINTGVSNISPVANAGTNKNITLPTNSVSQVGSGTDADGTISSYLWTAFSGPGTYTIVSPTSATTTINNLVAGTYVFQLRVTDNLGATGSDTVTVVVNAAPPGNVPPIANAGGNKTITLPTSTVTQVGSGTDSDGSIVSYAWTQTGGPITATIVSPTSATTVINGLTTAGTYAFTLTVTDNGGATGPSTATILVNGGPNVNPTALAGSDQVLTWPTNTANLSGGGTDTDGSIVAYSWTKFSGGVATITSPNSANTTITGLDIGVYQFQLLVTDNSGGTGTDIIQITVNKGSASLAFSNLTQTYTGSPLSPTVTTTPAGLSYSLTLGGVTGGKTNVGGYPAVAGITDSHWNFTPINATFTITQATAVISAVSKTVNFDGNPQSIVATVSPNVPGLTYLYNGSATPPSAIGTYSVDITLVNSDWQATPVNVTLTIVSNPAIIFISDTDKVYNGSPQSVTVTSAYSYSLTGSPQTNAGQYTVTATINDGIHSGSATATMTIAKQAAVLSWAQPAPQPYGTQLTVLILNASSNISGTWTYNYPLGTKLPIGTFGMTGTFVPLDNLNYSGGTVSTTISIFGVNPFLDYFISSNGQYFFIKQ